MNNVPDKHKISTWNVRSMNRGKLEVVMAKMDRIGLELLGVSEMGWSDCGQVQIDNFTVLYAGHNKLRRNGVAFIMNRAHIKVYAGVYRWVLLKLYSG